MKWMHKYHHWLTFIFSVCTLIMTISIFTLHLTAPGNKKAGLIIFLVWALVASVVLFVEAIMWRKIQRQFKQDRDEVFKLFDELRKGLKNE